MKHPTKPPKHPTTPTAWRYQRLQDILTETQLDAITNIVNKYHSHDQDISQCLPELNAFLSTIRLQLEAKEILPEYLAYCIIYALSQPPDQHSVTE